MLIMFICGPNFAIPSHDGHGVRLQKSATKILKEKHARRQEKKLQKRRAKGLPDPCYYKKDAKGRVSGGKDLASTAYYPARFCSAVHSAWKAEQSGFTGGHWKEWSPSSTPFFFFRGASQSAKLDHLDNLYLFDLLNCFRTEVGYFLSYSFSQVPHCPNHWC